MTGREVTLVVLGDGSQDVGAGELCGDFLYAGLST
jgi:hypothetical protein